MKIVYLLHRFPRVSDTFIMREISALSSLGTTVNIVSVWRPSEAMISRDATDDLLRRTEFLLPVSASALVNSILQGLMSPARFLQAVSLAVRTCSPGFKGWLKQLAYFMEALLTARVVRRLEAGHIHNHFGDHSGIVAMLAAHFAGVDYSISFHGPHVFFCGTSQHLKEKVMRAKFTRCISYFCRSQVALFSETSDLDSLKIVHCGIDLDEYAYQEPRSEVEVIFCAARLAPEKGFEFLLKALRLVKDQGHRPQLRIVGDGPSRPSLENLARQLQIDELVVFLGAVDEQTKNNELMRSDLYVLPSLAEGLPSALMEAMAVGVPVIATNIAGIGELVEDQENGILVSPTDVGGLARAILFHFQNPEFRKSSARLGREEVVRHFDLKTETAQLQRYLMMESGSCRHSTREA